MTLSNLQTIASTCNTNKLECPACGHAHDLNVGDSIKSFDIKPCVECGTLLNIWIDLDISVTCEK